MNLMRSVLEVARRDWKWIRVNPMTDVRWPKCPKGRARRIDVETVQALAEAFGVWDKLRADTATQRTGLAFLFALETAMRSGEILALTWPRSEEHTSELQSLMRISYAVFCLKKKSNKQM